MREDIAISVRNINKSFRLPHEKHSSLKDKAVHIFGPRKFTQFKALKEISFDIKKGEFFGIVGKNGSGKSTLLKIIANIYQPTKGRIDLNGTLAPFIELGVGFNPELTGRENVFLSGTILGMTRKKIESLYDEIVAFAELEEFMDQKLKNYSSGMQVRLAFSIAVRAESDILLIDEVLAVGDTNFQRKCLNYFDQLKKQKKTVVFVSHDMEAVKQFCDKALLISDGKVSCAGNPDYITTKYFELNTDKFVNKRVNNDGDLNNIKKLRAKITDSKGRSRTHFKIKDNINVQISWKKNPLVKNIGIAIMNKSGEFVFGKNTLNQPSVISQEDTSIVFEAKLSICSGAYYISYGIFGDSKLEVIDFVESGPEFIVEQDSNSDWDGAILLESKWLKK